MDSNEYKLGTDFRLALDVDYATRVRSLDLDVGYDSYQSTWELIIKYNGNLEKIANEIGFTYIELLNKFAIIKIKESDVDKLKNYSEILYIDKPKQMYVEQNTVKNICEQSCMRITFNDILGNTSELTGKGVLIAILDSGIDFRNKLFYSQDGKSKILYFWDQTTIGVPPKQYGFGTEYSNETIDDEAFLRNYDESGHGTAVASIAAGCAKDASFIIVKLSQEQGIECKTTSLICAIDYVIRIAQNLQMPLAINISYGNYYGDHAGNSILEEYIDSLSSAAKLSFIVGTGNDGNTGRHARIAATAFNTYQISFVVEQYESAINLQIWYSFFDSFIISIVTPDGIILGPINHYTPFVAYEMSDMKIIAISSVPSELNDKQELYFSFVPNNTYINSGVYTLIIETQTVTDGVIDLWLPVANSTNTNVKFMIPNPDITLTIPSTAQSVISVGAYDIRTERYANFSGRGFDANGRVKPDLCAPGVQIVIDNNNQASYVTGTSFATPVVTAAAALLMQWGIVEGNDVFMYGQKLKKYLIKGARPLIGDSMIPNSKIGYGALCLENSLKL